VKHYTVAEFEVIDPAWVADYVAHVTAMIERRGGRYLARTGRFQQVEGERAPPQVALLIEWPTREAATGFYESAEYAPYLRARLAGSRGTIYLVPGEDMVRPGLDLAAAR
jgi:uncharacterized protein (DUF1330 family)